MSSEEVKIFKFYISLTVHLGIILVNNHLDALFFVCLFHFSTCFVQPSAHHQESQLYLYIIWYIPLCVGGRLVCRSESSSSTCIPDGQLQRVIYNRLCIDTIDSPDDEHWVAQNMWISEINTTKKCIKLVINMNCTKMHGQQDIKLPRQMLYTSPKEDGQQGDLQRDSRRP
jgi:hypothetical protein